MVVGLNVWGEQMIERSDAMHGEKRLGAERGR